MYIAEPTGAVGSLFDVFIREANRRTPMGQTSALHHETTEQTAGVGSVAALWDLG